MNPRDLLLKELRGEAIGTITNQSSNEEAYQNQTLRPILKLQNDLFVASFENYITEKAFKDRFVQQSRDEI